MSDLVVVPMEEYKKKPDRHGLHRRNAWVVNAGTNSLIVCRKLLKAGESNRSETIMLNTDVTYASMYIHALKLTTERNCND